MKFSLVKKAKVTYYTTLMALSIEGISGSQLYGRKYYRVFYEDGTELLFLTSNEPDSDFIEHYLDEEFTLHTYLKELITNFEKTELEGIVIDARFNALPNYIYYSIISIDDTLKPTLLAHLKACIAGYTEFDFNEKEQKKLKTWMDYLVG